MPNFSDLQTALAEFNDKYRGPTVPRLELGQPYHIEKDYPTKWPDADSAGVYGFLDAAMNVLYIGKASLDNDIGSRIGTHLASDPSKPWGRKDILAEQAAYLITIPVPKGHRYVAPALEEWLIDQLQPPHNAIGRRNH